MPKYYKAQQTLTKLSFSKIYYNIFIDHEAVIKINSTYKFINKNITILKELYISIQLVDDYNLLLRAEAMEIHTKHHKPEKLHKIPIFILNKPLDY